MTNNERILCNAGVEYSEGLEQQQPDFVDQVIRYENGDMEDDEMVLFFQSLINNGMAWTLQGHYGRTAAALIAAGYCHEKGEVDA